MSIPFTQFLRPLGTPQEVEIDRSAHIEELAGRVLAAGGRFEIELLRDNTASLEVLFPLLDDAGDDVTIGPILVPNGPPVPIAVDRLVELAAALIDHTPTYHCPECGAEYTKDVDACTAYRPRGLGQPIGIVACNYKRVTSPIL